MILEPKKIQSVIIAVSRMCLAQVRWPVYILPRTEYYQQF